MQENEEEFSIDISSMLVAGKSVPGVQSSGSKAQTDAQAATTDGSQASGANQASASQGAAGVSAGLTTEADVFKAALANVDALQEMTEGKHLQYSSMVRPVNDSTAEYVVSTVKHFYDELIIVQYGIKNTLND